MDIILVSNRFAKAHRISLSGKHLLLAAIILLGTLFFAKMFAQRTFAELQPLIGMNKEGLEKQQSYMRNSLDDMAMRVGQMQAQMLRIDSLGARLTKMSGIKKQEFNFDEMPAQGGPLVQASQKDISFESLDQQLAKLSNLMKDRSDKLIAIETMQMQKSLDKRKFPSSMPVTVGNYSSNFGLRIDPFTGHSAMHEGVDFVAPRGTKIKASAAGVVVFAALHPQYGNMVEIDHGNDIITRYAHASKLLVKAGQVVRRGQVIAEVGSTGRSTGNHLHFEVRYKGIAQNPRRFIERDKG